MSEQVERLMRDGSAPDGGEYEAWNAYMDIAEGVLGRRLSFLEQPDPDDLPSFEETFGYTPGDQ